jgi:peptidoglycan hydrolase-like protein with peptidoglycan-binding domain
VTALNRIVWHHTGGGHRPGPADRRAYHFLIDGDGAVMPGDHPPEANAAPIRGPYAAHTLNLNSGSIGVAICALAQARVGVPVSWADPFGPTTSAPVRPVQVDALVRLTAELCPRYGIRPDRRFTLSHAEVQPTLGVIQRGKWDFDYRPRTGLGPRDPIAVGDELRAEVARLIAQAHAFVADPPSPRPVLRRGSIGEAVRELQRLLGIAADGQFGPITDLAVRAFQRRTQLLPDGIVGRMTWAALLP